MFPDFRKRTGLWNVSRLRPFVLLVSGTCRWRWDRSIHTSNLTWANLARTLTYVVRGRRLPASAIARSLTRVHVNCI